MISLIEARISLARAHIVLIFAPVDVLRSFVA